MKILVDVTEPQWIMDSLIALCSKYGIAIQRQELRRHYNALPETLIKNPYMGTGVDYIVLNGEEKPLLGIERKTLKDCVLSIVQKEERATSSGISRCGHIFRQLDNLKVFPNRIFMLEGYLPSKYGHFENHIYGLEFWCYRNQIGVIHTVDMLGSARAISLLGKKTLLPRIALAGEIII